MIGKLIEREPDFAKPISQLLEYIVQLAVSRGRMRSDHFEIGPADLLVEVYARSATQTAPLRMLMKNTADEK